MIKSLINPGNYPSNIHFVLLLLRVVSGSFMLSHGYGKMLKLLGDGPISFPDPLGTGATVALSLAVFSEVICALFLVLGFLTRLSAIPLLVTMLVAAFVVHAGDGFGKQELSLLYAVLYFTLLLTGSGKYSVDQIISKR